MNFFCINDCFCISVYQTTLLSTSRCYIQPKYCFNICVYIRPTQGAMGKAFMLSRQIWLPQSCYTKAWSDTHGNMITAVFNVCNTKTL